MPLKRITRIKSSFYLLTRPNRENCISTNCTRREYTSYHFFPQCIFLFLLLSSTLFLSSTSWLLFTKMNCLTIELSSFNTLEMWSREKKVPVSNFTHICILIPKLFAFSLWRMISCSRKYQLLEIAVLLMNPITGR